MKDNLRVSTSSNALSSKLEIKKTVVSDSGDYEITLSNSCGVATGNLLIL